MPETKALEKLAAFGKPETAIILGTGLGVMEEAIAVEHSIAYADIPGFPVSSVQGHSGRLIFGRLGQEPVVVMSGRFHLYEGYSARDVTMPIRLFKRLGVKRLLISNAAGGLRPELKPGSLMLIDDHINLSGHNPLIGPNDETLGPRFPDMTKPYCPALKQKALSCAERLGIGINRGVYVQLTGPSMETAAETRMLKIIGASAVGMSTVMEVIAAVHAGLDVLAISAITNNNDPDNYLPAPIEDVIANANVAGPLIARIFEAVLNS